MWGSDLKSEDQELYALLRQPGTPISRILNENQRMAFRKQWQKKNMYIFILETIITAYYINNRLRIMVSQKKVKIKVTAFEIKDLGN